MSENYFTSFFHNSNNISNKQNYFLINQFINKINNNSKLYQNAINSIENPEQINLFIPQVKMKKNKISNQKKRLSNKENINNFETPKNKIPYSSKNELIYSKVKKLKEDFYDINKYYFNPFPQIELKDPLKIFS